MYFFLNDTRYHFHFGNFMHHTYFEQGIQNRGSNLLSKNKDKNGTLFLLHFQKMT
jgi:hypothetical protein